MQQSGYCGRRACTMGLKRLLLAVLMVLPSVNSGLRSDRMGQTGPEVALALADQPAGNLIPGAPVDISKDDAVLQQVLLNATYLYNNQSNDAFLFKPSAIIRAQRQIVKGSKYLIDFQISRTVCRKRDAHTNLSRCDFQPKGLLHQTVQCHFVVWLIPWEEFAEEVLTCKS